ncbi:HAMP domain-containing protein [Lachnospiraceae bacterium]|nr:HAMP domain-containing protein [Lachnospiraceae bacterium]
MIEKTINFFKNLSIRYKLLLTFFLLLFVIAAGVTFAINYYNQRFIGDMTEESNKQIMKEMNAELDSIYAQINQLYTTFNNQDLYKIFLNEDNNSNFENVYKELQYESLIKNIINANNLQEHISGILLYANQDTNSYIGTGAINPNFQIEKTDWYKKFVESQTGRLLYGPFSEDLKSENSKKNNVIYFIRSWHIPVSSGISRSEYPFILFNINASIFTDIFKKYSGNTKVVLVTDSSHQPLFTVNMGKEEEEQIISIIEEHMINSKERETYFNKTWSITRTFNNNLGWNIYSAESTRDAFRDMNRLIRNIYLIILSAGGAAILLALYLTRKIIMPLTILNQMINKIEEKDVFLDIQTKDELGQIGERFNQMKRRMQDMAEKMYMSKMQEKEAQLSALQAQINPHFLYNTLDNIYCIAQVEGSEHIISLTDNLSKMMRYSMSMKNHYVPLAKELEHVKSYINILNVRFDDSILLDFQVEDAWDIEIPKLSMQPLAENAWNHGILPKKGHHGTIQFHISVQEDTCIIQVLDDGIGISLEKSQEINKSLEQINYDDTNTYSTGSGIALKNVNNRIMLEDGESYGVRLYPRDEGGCQVIVKMKLHK